MPLREELFTQGIACPMGDSEEDKAPLARWQCLRDYCFADETRNAKWPLILKLAARQPIKWCNDFLNSLNVANEDAYKIDDTEFHSIEPPAAYDQTLNSTEDAKFNALTETHPWLKETRYSDAGSRHILSNLNSSFDDNGESGLDRLKFYHDHHRLTALINLIKEGKLTILDAEGYDDFKSDKIPPRMLPRILAGNIDKNANLTKEQIAAYDLHDYDPKNNPRPTKMLSKEAFNQLTVICPGHQKDYDKYTNSHARDEEYLATYFDMVLKPVVTERARLCLDLQRLKKQEEALAQKPLTNLQWFYYLFYKTPTQECELVTAKIALFSGAIEAIQQFIRVTEDNMNCQKIDGQNSDLLYPGPAHYLSPETYHVGDILNMIRNDYITERYTSKNSVFIKGIYKLHATDNYLSEFLGKNVIDDNRTPRNKQIVIMNEPRFSEEERMHLKPQVINDARDEVAAFFKGLVGSLLTVASAGTALLSTNFRHTFFGTQSFNCLDKAKESSAALAEKIEADALAVDRLENPSKYECCSFLRRH